ncbi:MAG: hypothetical protein GF418_07385, partial [Chitinivibrionales bacterium]|nr:hypothetical protein [Chitinivibrionales bacterium]MBD3395434.1 hypothetical protein [Chitinivibrionales bacterium]
EHARALLWHQGETDTQEDRWLKYAARFDTLYHAWHQDYPRLQSIYLFQIRPVTCGGEGQSRLREIQRVLPNAYPDIGLMSTAGLAGFDGCHYTPAGYNQMAEWIYPFVARDLYGSTDTSGITPPSVHQSYFTGPGENELAVVFDQQVVWPADTLGASMKDYFLLDGQAGMVDSGWVRDDSIAVLKLTAPSDAARVTYLPNCWYNDDTTRVYRGPWVRNTRGIGALSFHELPIDRSEKTLRRSHPSRFEVHVETSHSTVTARLVLPRPGNVTVDFMSPDGRLVARVSDLSLGAGTHTVRLRAAAFAQGLYLCRIMLDRRPLRTMRALIIQ